jgi:hypothetical protein
VEPEPEFFRRFVEVVDDTERALDDAGAFDVEAGRVAMLADLRDFGTSVGALDRDAGLDRGWAVLDQLGTERRIRLTRVLRMFYEEAFWADRHEQSGEKDDRTQEARDGAILRRMLTLARKRIEGLEQQPPADDLYSWIESDARTLRERWRALARIVHRLESMAGKELRGVAFDGEDDGFLRSYAEWLAFPMLYDGNAFSSPPSDIPPVVNVFTVQTPGEPARCLHAAVAMPCAIYVLWPDGDHEVLCRGAVMPYREFVDPKRLTDAEWRQRFTSKDAPPAPAWMAGITAPVRRPGPR